MTLEILSNEDVVRALRAFRDALAANRSVLNRLNVYPVPDGDTGTNMSLTVDAMVTEIDRVAGDGNGRDMTSSDADGEAISGEALAEAVSRGSLMGARGNSGVILSQIMRGLAGAIREASPSSGLGPAEVAGALRRAADGAYAAVSNPVEGTILSVARAAAEGAESALRQGGTARESAGPARASLLEVLESARDEAASALERTTEQLPALAAAGVVDAGGAGLLLLYDGLLHAADGRGVALPATAATAATEAQQPEGRGEPAREVGDLRYEVMFFLEAPDEAVPAFRDVWAGYGGSIVIVGGDGLYNCHIHTDDIGGAIEAAIEIGRPRQIRVTDLAEQVEEERWVREAEARGSEVAGPPAEPVATSVVAVCEGEGVKRVFRSLGVRDFVAGGQSTNPSVTEVLQAVAEASADQVVLLPNNANVVPVAEQAAANSGKKARVVTTGGIAEGFAALLAYDPETDVDTNAENMADAAARVLPGEVAQAVRDSHTPAGLVRKGDWLGVSRGVVRVVVPEEAGAAGAATALLAALVPAGADGRSEDGRSEDGRSADVRGGDEKGGDEKGGDESSEDGSYQAGGDDACCEMVTLIEGEGATPAATRQIVEWLSENRPWLTAEVHHGGQPLYPYVLGVE